MPLVGSAPPRVEAAPLREALRSVSAALRSVPDRGMIIGDIATIARGVARRARDVQATMATTRDVGFVFGQFERYSIRPRVDDPIAFARARQSLPMRHVPTDVDVDLSLAWLPFELDALAAAEDMLLGSVEITVARAEDLVIYKAVSWQPHDREDVERLAALHGNIMDLARIRRVVAVLAETLADPGRASDVARALERGLRLAP
jgi:hypothetical protein